MASATSPLIRLVLLQASGSRRVFEKTNFEVPAYPVLQLRTGIAKVRADTLACSEPFERDKQVCDELSWRDLRCDIGDATTSKVRSVPPTQEVNWPPQSSSTRRSLSS